MTAPADCFARLDTMRSTDTGSGGLAQVGGAALVRAFHLIEDPNYEPVNWPDIGIQIIESERDSFAKDRVDLLVKWNLKTEYEPGMTARNAVVDQIRALYHRQDIGSSATWDFSSASLSSFVGVGLSPDRKRHDLASMVIRARKV